jgi:hypothetical protein
MFNDTGDLWIMWKTSFAAALAVTVLAACGEKPAEKASAPAPQAAPAAAPAAAPVAAPATAAAPAPATTAAAPAPAAGEEKKEGAEAKPAGEKKD